MEEIAEVYSRSLFEVAQEHDVLDRVHDELGEFADALDENRDLQVFFFSPYFSAKEKKEGIEQAVDDADERFVHFLELLAERHRLPAIFRIRREYDRMWAEENKLLRGLGDHRGQARRGDRERHRQADRGADRPRRSSCRARSTPASSAAWCSGSAT